MKKLLSLPIAILLLVACNQAATPNASGSAEPSGSPSATSRASASAPATASAATKQIELQVVVPEPNAKAGIGGGGWTVDIIAKGNGPSMDAIKPAFTTSSGTGRNAAFPGLVVMIKSTGQGGQAADPKTNLARLFQIIGLPNTIGSIANISSVQSTSSSSPTASSTPAGSASATASPAGTAATRTTTTTDTSTAEATWFVQQLLWGTDVDVELTAFVVDGNAPDTVSDKTQLKIVSNEVTVTFHINGSGNPQGTSKPSAAPSGSVAPSTTPTGSTSPSPSPSPSASPSSTP